MTAERTMGRPFHAVVVLRRGELEFASSFLYLQSQAAPGLV